jgi:hypothetical protein
MRLIFRSFGMLATGNFRGLFSLLLGLALIGGLWQTSLSLMSTRATATAIMTDVGVEFINPILENDKLGLSQSAYASLEQQATAHPTQALTVPFLNPQRVQVLGSDIAGKDFNHGMTIIYGKVAAAYYDGDNLTGLFAVPASVTQALSLLSKVSPLPQASQSGQAAGAPQLPSVPLPPLAAVGLSLGTLTAQGHGEVQSLDYWFLGVAAVLALLVALFSHRWGRVTGIAWALISSTIPGLFGIGVIWFFWARYPATFQPFSLVLKDIGGAFVPVYIGAAILGVVGLALAGIGDFVVKLAGVRPPAKVRSPAPAGAARAQGWDEPAGGLGRPVSRPPVGTGPSYAPAEPYGQGGRVPPLEPTQPFQPQSNRDPWAMPPVGSSRPPTGADWPPSPAAAPPRPPSPSWAQPDSSGWNAPDRPGPVGPSQPAYGRPVPPEDPWSRPGPPPPFGPPNPARQPWPPQDDPDPWPPRR